jgi:hypothetical protein
VPDARLRLAVAAVLFAVGSAQAADVITFIKLMAIHGAAAEANPLVAQGYGLLGVLPLIAAKVALVVLVVALFAVIAQFRGRLGSLVATTAMVGGLVGAFANVYAF